MFIQPSCQNKWRCISIALSSSLLTAQSALQRLSQSPNHRHIHTLMEEAAMQGANCTPGTMWFRILLKDTSTCSLGFEPATVPITGPPAVPPELQPPWNKMFLQTTDGFILVCVSREGHITCYDLTFMWGGGRGSWCWSQARKLPGTRWHFLTASQHKSVCHHRIFFKETLWHQPFPNPNHVRGQ